MYPLISRYIPNFVCGDMDSARKDVLEFFESKVLHFAGDDQDYVPVVSCYRAAQYLEALTKTLQTLRKPCYT